MQVWRLSREDKRRNKELTIDELYTTMNFWIYIVIVLVAGSIVYKKAICIAIQYPHIMLCYGSSNNTLIKECCGQ